MVGDDLTVCLFLVGLGFNFVGIAVTQAGWKHKVLIGVLFGLGGLCFVSGISWVWLKNLPPVKVQSVIAEVAASPISWFVMMMALLMLAMLPKKPSTISNLGMEWPPALPPIEPEPFKIPPNVPIFQREFTNKSPGQLLAVFDGVTELQGASLFEPYVGLWLRTEGVVTSIFRGISGARIASFTNEGVLICCSFSEEWEMKLRTYDPGSTMKVIGKIRAGKIRGMLNLDGCELDKP